MLKRIIIALTALCSFNAVAESIDCRIMREQLLAEARNPYKQEEDAYNRAYKSSGGSNNPFSGLAALSSMYGQRAGQELAGVSGGSQSFEERVQQYKYKCEK